MLLKRTLGQNPYTSLYLSITVYNFIGDIPVPRKEQIISVVFSILLLLNVLIVFSPTYFLPVAKAEVGGPVLGEDSHENLTGDWKINVSDTRFYGNRTLNLTGNLTIYGNLTLQNVTIRFNSTYDGQHGIYVMSGGTLVIRDNDGDRNTTGDGCNITAVNTSNAFLFKVWAGSNFTMKNSKLSYCGYGRGGDWGLYVRTYDAIVTGNVIENNYYSIILNNAKDSIITYNNCSNNHYGIYLYSSIDNTIMNNICNLNIEDGIGVVWESDSNNVSNNICKNNGGNGMYLYTSDHNDIMGNVCNKNNIGGLKLRYSYHNNVTNNNVGLNNNAGILLEHAQNIKVKNNTMKGSGISIFGDYLKNWNTHSIDTSNTVNGNPVYYWKNMVGYTIPNNAGGVILVNCSEILVHNLNIFNSSTVIEVAFSSKITIKNNSIVSNVGFGIYLSDAKNNIIENNTCNNNSLSGIYVYTKYGNCSYNVFRNNTCNSNKQHGIYIQTVISGSSSDHLILENNTCNNNSEKGIGIQSCSANIGKITNSRCNNNDYGIYVSGVNNHHPVKRYTISNNTCMLNHMFGLYILYGNVNSIVKNICSFNSYGIRIKGNNNNVINNTCESNLQYALRIDYDGNNISLNNCSGNINGIILNGGKNCKVLNNYISLTGTGNGIFVDEAESCNISNNVILKGDYGIYLNEAKSQTIYGNTMVQCGLYILGDDDEWDSHIIGKSNKVNGKPVIYHINKNGGLIQNNVGQVILVKCRNILIEGITLNNSSTSILVGFSDSNIIINSTLCSNKGNGVLLYESNSNSIINNSINSNGKNGIWISQGDNNRIIHNNISFNRP